MNRPDTEIIPDVCCPKCKEPIAESTYRYCSHCKEPLISLHTSCVNCSFSSIDAMTGGISQLLPDVWT